jgi:hypothetical protein
VRPQIRAVAGVVGAYGLLDQSAEVLAAGVVGGGEAEPETGLAQGEEGRFLLVGDVLGADAEEQGRTVVGFLFHDAVPDEALVAGRQGLERREHGRRRVLGGPDAGQPGGQQEELVTPRDTRFGAARRLPGRGGEDLRRQPLCGGLADGALPCVGEDRRAVACAQFAQCRVGDGGVGA